MREKERGGYASHRHNILRRNNRQHIWIRRARTHTHMHTFSCLTTMKKMIKKAIQCVRCDKVKEDAKYSNPGLYEVL